MSTDTLNEITTNEVKAYHGVASSDTEKDAQIDVIRPLVADFIEQYCRHDFQSIARANEKPVVEARMNSFYLKYRPVASIATLVEDGETLTEDTDFFVDKDIGRVEKIRDKLIFTRRGEFGYWSTGPNAIVVNYVGGEALSTAQDIVMVFYEWVGILAYLKTKTFITNEGIEGVVTLTSLPPHLIAILERHKWARI